MENEILEKTTDAIVEASDDSDGGVAKTLVKVGTYVLAGLVGYAINEIRHKGLPFIGKSKKKDKFDDEFDITEETNEVDLS